MTQSRKCLQSFRIKYKNIYFVAFHTFSKVTSPLGPSHKALALAATPTLKRHITGTVDPAL